jgi:type IV fimbrial biogenesis protein FimT
MEKSIKGMKLVESRPGMRSVTISGSAVFRHRGFTMVEVMIVVVLLGIMLSLALPSFVSMVEKRQLVRSAEQIAAFLNSVKGISSSANQAVTVHYDRDDHRNWCIGASLDTDPDSTTGDCDCEVIDPLDSKFCAINGVEYRTDDDDTNDMRFMHSMSGSEGGDDTFTIDPVRGILWDANDSFELSTHHGRSNYHLNIEVNRTGDVIVCSRSSGEAIPGYEVCS